jgi:uncharacterized protein YbaP (TraB family)
VASKKLRSAIIRVAVCVIYSGSLLLALPADAAEKRSLWRVRSKNNVVYLLGSIHYLKAQNYPLAEEMEAAFKDAKKLIFEINLESAEGGRAQQLMASKGIYTDQTTLKEHVAPATYALAEKQLKELGLDIQIFNQFKPWFTALTVLALKLQAMGFDPGKGIDQYFFRKAKKEKKEVDGFETLEYQFGLFDGLPERVQESLLLQTLSGGDLTETGVDGIVKAWAAGDIQALETILLQGMKEFPEVYQRLIVDRNQAWLPKIEFFLSQNEF